MQAHEVELKMWRTREGNVRSRPQMSYFIMLSHFSYSQPKSNKWILFSFLVKTPKISQNGTIIKSAVSIIFLSADYNTQTKRQMWGIHFVKAKILFHPGWWGQACACLGWSEYWAFQAHQNKRLRSSALSQLKSSGNKRFCSWITAIMGTNSKCPCRGHTHTHTNAAQADLLGTNLQWRFTVRDDVMSSCCASQYWLASISCKPMQNQAWQSV